MSNEESTTLKNILSAGKAEFLEKDFVKAKAHNTRTLFIIWWKLKLKKLINS